MLNVKKSIMTCKSSAVISNICVLLHAMSQCLDPVGNFKKKKKPQIQRDKASEKIWPAFSNAHPSSSPKTSMLKRIFHPLISSSFKDKKSLAYYWEVED